MHYIAIQRSFNPRPHKTKDRSDRNNYRGISLVAHAGKLLLKIAASRLSNYCEDRGILPEEHAALVPHDQQSTCCSSCDDRKNTDERNIPLYVCFIDMQKAYDSVDRELLWQVLTCFGVPAKMLTVTRHFDDGMRACIRADDGEHSESFHVAQGLRQGCVLSLLLFNVFTAAIHVVLVRFSEDEDRVKDWNTSRRMYWSEKRCHRHACKGRCGVCCTPMTQE